MYYLNKYCSMIPITTVTFTHDKWQILLQAHSIEKFVEEPTTHYVIIEDNKTSLLEWRCLLEPIYNKHKLVIIDQTNYKQIYPKTLNLPGYYKQQYLKLTTCSLIDDKYVLSLDSKNVFFKPINLYEEFYGNEGGGTILSEEIQNYSTIVEYYSGWIKVLQKSINDLKPNQIFYPNTPFVFNTEKLKDFLNKYCLEDIFSTAIKDNVPVSEYILYSYIAEISNFKQRLWGSGNNDQWFGSKKFIESSINSLLFVISRPSLDQTNNRYYTSDFLTKCGLEEKYVIPAVYLTPTSNR